MKDERALKIFILSVRAIFNTKLKLKILLLFSVKGKSADLHVWTSGSKDDLKIENLILPTTNWVLIHQNEGKQQKNW